MTRTQFLRALAAAAVMTFATSAHASAQLFEIAHTTAGLSGIPARSAFDPVHDCYFVVAGDFGVGGRFVSRGGATLGTVSLDDRGSYFVGVTYSPDVSDGAGGFGGFVAIWSRVDSMTVNGQIVAFPGRLVGPRTTIRPTDPTVIQINRGGIGYSPVHRVFLVGVSLYTADAPNDLPSRIIRLDLSAQPISEAPLAASPNNACPGYPVYEVPLLCNEIDVEWNPVSREFGVLHNRGAQKVLARVSGDGTILGETPLGIGTFYGALAVNSTTGAYFAVGAGDITDGAEVNSDGALIARGTVTSMLDTQSRTYALPDLAYSPVSGTFLLSGLLRESSFVSHSVIMELNQHGVPLGSTLTLAGHIAPVASHPSSSEWLAAPTDGEIYVIGTRTPFGGSSDHLADCITPDPFVVLGGGTCYKAGWLPPGITPPAPPVLTAGGCILPDPFAALGGGTCANRGWLPPGMAAAPPPLVLPGGCTTPDPFTILGGGTCANGGWLPPGMTAPSPPPVLPGGCTTPDPFVAIGGGTCANGGWTPRGS